MSDILNKRIELATSGERIDVRGFGLEACAEGYVHVIGDVTRLTAALNILFPNERNPTEKSIDCAIRLLEKLAPLAAKGDE